MLGQSSKELKALVAEAKSFAKTGYQYEHTESESLNVKDVTKRPK